MKSVVKKAKRKSYDELYERLGTQKRKKIIDWLRLDKSDPEIFKMFAV